MLFNLTKKLRQKKFEKQIFQFGTVITSVVAASLNGGVNRVCTERPNDLPLKVIQRTLWQTLDAAISARVNDLHRTVCKL